VARDARTCRAAWLLPAIEMMLTPRCFRRAAAARHSAVRPECERSPSAARPRSPCAHSVAWTNCALVPVDASDTAKRRATMADLPMPDVNTRRVLGTSRMMRHASLMDSASSSAGRASRAAASARSDSSAGWTWCAEGGDWGVGRCGDEHTCTCTRTGRAA
jgi:hypothetical protein